MTSFVLARHFNAMGGASSPVDPKDSNRIVKFLRRYCPHSAVNLSIALCIVVSLGVSIFGASMLLVARADAWQEVKDSLNNLALAMDRDLSRTISVYDLSLQGVLDVLQDPGLSTVSPSVRQAAMFDRAASAEYLGSMVVLDKFGIVTADSTSIEPHRFNLADRDYFQVQRDHPDLGLYISLPYASRFRGGDVSVAMSRRIPTVDGQFGGAVVGSLRMSYFKQLFENYRLGAAGRIALLRTDGRLLARYPGNDALLGHDFSGSDIFKAIGSSPAGS